MQIPGISDLLDKGTIPDSLLLLIGPAGAGKTMYCRQFFSDGLFDGDYCIYISSSLTSKQFRNHFSNVEKLNLVQNSKFINPYLYHRSLDSREQYSPSIPTSANDDNTDSDDDDRAGGRMIDNENSASKLSLTLNDIRDSLAKITKYIDNEDDGEVDRSIGNVGSTLDHKNTEYSPLLSNPLGNNNRSVRIVVDSLTHLLAVFGENAVLKFVNDLSFLLKEVEAMAIFTLTTPSTREYLTNALSSIFDGIIEMKLEEHNEGLNRSVRLLSIKGLHYNPSWIKFKIIDDGSLAFADQSSS